MVPKATKYSSKATCTYNTFQMCLNISDDILCASLKKVLKVRCFSNGVHILSISFSYISAKSILFSEYMSRSALLDILRTNSGAIIIQSWWLGQDHMLIVFAE